MWCFSCDPSSQRLSASLSKYRPLVSSFLTNSSSTTILTKESQYLRLICRVHTFSLSKDIRIWKFRSSSVCLIQYVGKLYKKISHRKVPISLWQNILKNKGSPWELKWLNICGVRWGVSRKSTRWFWLFLGLSDSLIRFRSFSVFSSLPKKFKKQFKL